MKILPLNFEGNHMQSSTRAKPFRTVVQEAESGNPEACISAATYFPGNILARIAWYNKAYSNGFSIFPQHVLIDILGHFCRNPRYNPKNSRFSETTINSLANPGICAGMTSRFLLGAYLEKNDSIQEQKNEDSAKKIKESLKQFHREIKTIVSWDGKRNLTPLEQQDFLSFLYLVIGYQNKNFRDDLNQHQLDRLAFINDEITSFKRELGVTLFITQEQLAKKLDTLRQPNRMIAISIPSHMMGIFENNFIGPNNYNSDKKYLSSEEITKDLFKEIEILKYPADKPITISIDIFAHQSEATPATYPAYSDLMADSGSGMELDPYYKSTGLHMAAKYGHNESLKYFLTKRERNVNAQDYLGNTALHLAAQYGQIECIRSLCTEETCIETYNNLGLTPFHVAIRCCHTDCVNFFLTEKKHLSRLAPSGPYNAFHLACLNSDNLDIARLLLQHGFELTYPTGMILDNRHPDPNLQTLFKNIEKLKQEQNQDKKSETHPFFAPPHKNETSTKLPLNTTGNRFRKNKGSV